MQGKKIYQEKLFNDFRLSERVPEHNFYRRLHSVLDLNYLYVLTKDFYGGSGQKSIDPVVFFKLCLVGYLENITSDRKLVEHCGMRLDILLFLGYGIDEELPWHSTISRTRQLFPEDVFEAVFTKVFTLCVESGMVSGHTQAVDSAPVKANASMDSLELKVPEEELEAHLRKLRHISARDRQRPLRQAGTNKEKKFSVTYYRAEYQRNIARVNSPQGRYMKGKRQSTMEPVFGTLTQFMGLGKVNTIGLAQANKCMHLSAMAYNLKKYLKFIKKRTKSGAASLAFTFLSKRWLHQCITPFLRHPNIAHL